MKLEKVLDQLNSFEKNSFLKIVSDIVSSNPKNASQVDKILSDSSKGIKNIDNVNVAKVFRLIKDEYASYLESEFVNTTSQLDILTDILIKDGNCMMKQDWFSRLYEVEIKSISKKVKALEKSFKDESSDVDVKRRRDYKIYRECLNTAFTNDDEHNSERKVTKDEQSILSTLSNQLELSQEEIKLINYMIIPVVKQPVDDVVSGLKNIGVLFYSRKGNTIYIADEMVSALRKVRGKDVADKFFRRVLKLMRESQINLICKKHNIDWRLPLEEKVKEIIEEGISFRGVLANDMHKDSVNLSDKKKVLKELCDNGLKISPILKGVTIEEKLANLVQYFAAVERDEKVGISVDGYEKLLIDLSETIPKLNGVIKSEFELQDVNVMVSDLLLDYNIKPRDVLELVTDKELKKFCEARGVKTRGDDLTNVLNSYKDSENLYLENYVNIGYRDLMSLKDNGIKVKEADLGVKFEFLTKSIFTLLGFDVDEVLRKKLNTKKHQMDVVLNLGDSSIIIVECKTSKESGYNKFSSVSRQLKSYVDSAKVNDYNVVKSLLVAPEFSDEFVNDCELECELNLSLITAQTLLDILEGFKKSKHKQLPYKLLLRDVLIQGDRIVRAVNK